MAKKKYRKAQKGRVKGKSSRGNRLEYGSFGIKALEACRITKSQIEAARKVIRWVTKRVGKLWIRVVPDIPYTKKPLETRMGKGKGGVEGEMGRIKPGFILYEMSGISRELALVVFEKVRGKLPIKVKFVSNEDL